MAVFLPAGVVALAWVDGQGRYQDEDHVSFPADIEYIFS